MERWSLNRFKIKLAGGFLKLNDYRMNFWTAIKIRLVINEIAKKSLNHGRKRFGWFLVFCGLLDKQASLWSSS